MMGGPFVPGFIVLLLLFGSSPTLIPPAFAQDGFTSIDCGTSAAPRVDELTSITWVGDEGYVFTGNPGVVMPSLVPVELQTLRFFPGNVTPAKNCYTLPVQQGNAYLVRAGFFHGNYDLRGSPSVHFQIALDSTPWQNISIDSWNEVPVHYEAIIGPNASTVSVCLIRTEVSSSPFINSLELRLLPPSTYLQSPSDANLYLISRANFGELNRTIRFPYDSVDRIWPPYLKVFPELASQGTPISTSQPIMNDHQSNDPPLAVMQTALTGQSLSWSRRLPLGPKVVAGWIYLAEYDATQSPSDLRSLLLALNWSPDIWTLNLTGIPSYYTAVWAYPLDDAGYLAGWDSWVTTFMKDGASNIDAIVSADELYLVETLMEDTDPDDVTAMLNIKQAFGFQQWSGDPCYPIPWDEVLCTQNRVTALDLSNKGLSGPVPSSIAGLAFLMNLNISNNQLTGSFPSWVTSLPLQKLDVSNNQLTGAFPSSLTQLGANFRYFGNSQLVCVPDVTSSIPCPGSPPPSAQVVSVSGPPGPGKGSSSRIVGVVFGIVFTVLATVIVVALTIFYCQRQKKRHVMVPPAADTLRAHTEDVQMQSFHLLQPNNLGGGRARPFTLAEIQAATDTYSRKIGVGGFGPVYYGVLEGQKEIAVKFLSRTSRQGQREFLNEIELLSTVYHRNLVPMVGYCQESTELILVYEYMSGGSLHSRLFGSSAASFPLSWRQRLQIALEAARGLEYLHHYCKPAIIHRDVKCANILLTNMLEVKITDFGYSKLTTDGADHVTTEVRGTKGYVDPEYSHSGMLTDKSDVYSFGIVLLELVTGKPALDEAQETPVELKFIVNWVRSEVNKGDLGRMVDPFLPVNYSVDAAWKLVEVAMTCVEGSGARRPTMMQVVRELTEVLEMEMRSTSARGLSNVPDPTLYIGNTSLQSSQDPVPR